MDLDSLSLSNRGKEELTIISGPISPIFYSNCPKIYKFRSKGANDNDAPEYMLDHRPE